MIFLFYGYLTYELTNILFKNWVIYIVIFCFNKYNIQKVNKKKFYEKINNIYIHNTIYFLKNIYYLLSSLNLIILLLSLKKLLIVIST